MTRYIVTAQQDRIDRLEDQNDALQDELDADHAALVRALKESRAETEAMRLHKEAQREANLNGAKRLAEVVGERDALVRLVEALPKPNGDVWIAYVNGRWEVRDKYNLLVGPFPGKDEKVAEAYKALLQWRQERA